MLFCLTGFQKEKLQHSERVCMHTHVCVIVCVLLLDWEGSWVFASTALVVVLMAVYLPGHNDYLTGFHEPLSTHYRYHTDFKYI